MLRRDFIAGLGSAVTTAAWPHKVHAQPSATPVVGWLSIAPLDEAGVQMGGVHRGLAETGFIAGQNLTSEYRSVDYNLDRMPAVAAEFVRRRVAVLGTGTLAGALAAKAATQTIPIVFVIGGDPVELGIIAGLARPGGNITGATNLSSALAAKRLEMLHELVPTATLMALLVNPTGPIIEVETRETQIAASALGLRLQVVNAALPRELEEAFVQITASRAGALLVGSDSLFINNRDRLVALTSMAGIPAIYAYGDITRAGGFMSYNAHLADTFRLAGTYVGRILKGEKPGDLPVQQSSKIELVINMKTAKALRLTFPLSLLGRADEVIE